MLRLATVTAAILGLAACAQQPMASMAPAPMTSAPMTSAPMTPTTAPIAAAPPTTQTGSKGYQGNPLIGQGHPIAPINAGQASNLPGHTE